MYRDEMLVDTSLSVHVCVCTQGWEEGTVSSVAHSPTCVEVERGVLCV